MHELRRWFDHEHLTREDLKQILEECGELAMEMDNILPDCAEKTAGMRKLVEAKDCFVRAAV